jgi:PAS domain S-box-containing protein
MDCNERKQQLEKKTAELDWLQKKINCLYRLSELVEMPNLTITDIVKGAVDIVSEAWPDPEQIFTSIHLPDCECRSQGFRESVCFLKEDIIVEGSKEGFLHVCTSIEDVNVASGLLRDEERELLRAVAQQLGRVIARKRGEEELRKLSYAVTQSPSAIMITDPAGIIEYYNPRTMEITGYSGEEIIGRNASELGDQSQQEMESMWKTISSGRKWRGEFYNRRKNDEQYWESASISAIRDEAGTITHFVKVSEDITALKEAREKLRAQEKELQQEQKRRAVLEFANDSSMTLMHELINPLVSIGGFARRLATHKYSENKIREFTDIIAKQSDRLEAALNKVLEHIKKTAEEV